MIPSSSCPPRPPDETGQTRRRAHTHCRSYTTPWGTIQEFLSSNTLRVLQLASDLKPIL